MDSIVKCHCKLTLPEPRPGSGRWWSWSDAECLRCPACFWRRVRREAPVKPPGVRRGSRRRGSASDDSPPWARVSFKIHTREVLMPSWINAKETSPKCAKTKSALIKRATDFQNQKQSGALLLFVFYFITLVLHTIIPCSFGKTSEYPPRFDFHPRVENALVINTPTVSHWFPSVLSSCCWAVQNRLWLTKTGC